MVGSLPPLACALCDHPIAPPGPAIAPVLARGTRAGDLGRSARCPRCGHRHGLGARHRLALEHIQRRRTRAAVDLAAADEAQGRGDAGAGLRFVAAVAGAAALPFVLRPLTERVDLHGEAWLIVSVGLVVAVAMAAALHVLLQDDLPAVSTPVRVDAASLGRALLDAETAAWRAAADRHAIALDRLRRGHRSGLGLIAVLTLALAGALAHVVFGVGRGVGLAQGLGFMTALAAAGLVVAHALGRLRERGAREITAARRIAGALGPAAAARVHRDLAAIAGWMTRRWASALDLTEFGRGAAVSIGRGPFEAIATVVAASYTQVRRGVARLQRPEMVRVFVPFVTAPLAPLAAEAARAAALVQALQDGGWQLRHDPSAGLQATRLAPSEAIYFTHEQLVTVAQTLPALLDLAEALGGVPPEALRERPLTTLQEPAPLDA